jgi:hypothetical protein
VSDQGVRAVRLGAVLYAALGIGFGLGSALTLWHLDRHGELPITPFGFRSMAGGPFEQLGPQRFAILGWSLVAVSTLDVVAGIWLWQGRRRGLRLGLATTVPAMGLGAGFALPFLLVGVPVRVLLVMAGRRHLS